MVEKNYKIRAWRTWSWVSSRLERLKLQLNCRVLIGVCFVFVTGCVWSTCGDIAGHILRNWSRVPRLFVVTRYCQQWTSLRKGWLLIAKLKPFVERYSCQPMRSLDTSNNLSVGPSCMWRTWNSWLCYLVSNTAGRRPGWEEQRDREKQGERGRAGEEQWKGRGKLLNLVIQVTGVE